MLCQVWGSFSMCVHVSMVCVFVSVALEGADVMHKFANLPLRSSVGLLSLFAAGFVDRMQWSGLNRSSEK